MFRLSCFANGNGAHYECRLYFIGWRLERRAVQSEASRRFEHSKPRRDATFADLPRAKTASHHRRVIRPSCQAMPAENCPAAAVRAERSPALATVLYDAHRLPVPARAGPLV
jgi:hypothetical protein